MTDCLYIVFGASGDLAKRKLIPALYKLLEQKKFNKMIILGVAYDDTIPTDILLHAKKFAGEVDPAVWQDLTKRFFYQPLNFTEKDDYVLLAKRARELEKEHKLTGNRVLYCAASSEFFIPITEYSAQVKLIEKKTKKDKIWHRIVYEKPFGYDLPSAHAINLCIAKYLNEIQIYRIDHYLTKEIVGNIALVRFTNCVFEPLWDHRYIDNVQIILSEEVGIGDRGSYYDKFGALRDVVQNHMLELVALIGMESPEMLTGEYVRTERAKVLEDIKIVDAVLGQYEGYTKEKHVSRDSKTETFAQVLLRIENTRWAGVPFYLKTGKALNKKETTIHIKFKQVDCLLAKNCPSESNYLTIQVSPEASFTLSLNAKKPGFSHEVVPVKMEFCHSCIFGTVTPESYEVILEEVVRGEQSISVRFDEIESSWRVIDSIEDKKLPVYPYKKGTAGPKQAEEFLFKHGVRWLS